MQVISMNNKDYYAKAPRVSTGLYPLTCDGFTKRYGKMEPIRSQIKLYNLAKILKGEAICKEI